MMNLKKLKANGLPDNFSIRRICRGIMFNDPDNGNYQRKELITDDAF